MRPPQWRAELRWRYVVLGLGFLALAGVRAAEGAPVWAAVFVVAAVANGWLARHEASPRPAAAPAVDPVPVDPVQVDPVPVDPAQVDRSLDGHRAAARRWQVLGGLGVLVGAGLLLVEPSLAVYAGAAALFALHRARRAGRCVATLLRVPAAVTR